MCNTITGLSAHWAHVERATLPTGKRVSDIGSHGWYPCTRHVASTPSCFSAVVIVVVLGGLGHGCALHCHPHVAPSALGLLRVVTQAAHSPFHPLLYLQPMDYSVSWHKLHTLLFIHSCTFNPWTSPCRDTSCTLSFSSTLAPSADGPHCVGRKVAHSPFHPLLHLQLTDHTVSWDKLHTLLFIHCCTFSRPKRIH